MPFKMAVTKLLEELVENGDLVPVHLEGASKAKHWVPAELMDAGPVALDEGRVQIPSPFDPLMIQRRRTKLFFDYEHKFEAYVPAAKRVMGYFALPMLMGDTVVAALDLKMDRQADKLLVQKWSWTSTPRAGAKAAIEQALGEFEAFQRR